MADTKGDRISFSLRIKNEPGMFKSRYRKQLTDLLHFVLVVDNLGPLCEVLGYKVRNLNFIL